MSCQVRRRDSRLGAGAQIAFIALFVVSCAYGQPMKSTPAKERLDSIAKALQEGSVATVEILHVPTSVLTYNRLTQKGLETTYLAKLTIPNLGSSAHRSELAEAFRGLTVSAADDLPDLRWAVILFNQSGQRIGAIYVSGDGRGGAVDEIPVTLAGPFHGWLKRSFASVLK